MNQTTAASRHGFLPPRYQVHRRGPRNPPIPVLTDLRGRPPLPAARVRRRRHPCLLDLAELRAKLRHEPFRTAAAELPPFPDEPDTSSTSLAITRDSMNWFRVGKETMLRDGAGNRRPAARHIWPLQSRRAQAAWRSLVKSVTPTDEQLAVLMSELNRVLARRDFYDVRAFAKVQLPAEGEALLRRGLERLSAESLFRFNRIALQSAVECVWPFRADLVHWPGHCLERWVVTRERLLIDPGYYKEQPTDHCLPLINGRGPHRPGGWTGQILACQTRGMIRYLAVDATAGYDGAAKRVVRHLVVVGEGGLVLLDDIVADGEVTAQYQCGGVTRKLASNQFLITGQKAKLRVVVTPAGPMTLHPERDLHDVHWGYHFATCRWFPVTATYRLCGDTPLVTVLLDETKRRAGKVRLNCGKEKLTATLPSGNTVQFWRELSGWVLR